MFFKAINIFFSLFCIQFLKMEEKRSFCWFVLALALSVAQVKASNFLRFQGTGITSNVANILGFGVDDMMQRCVSVPNALCVGGTNKIIMPKSVAPDLIGWWSFDGGAFCSQQMFYMIQSYYMMLEFK